MKYKLSLTLHYPEAARNYEEEVRQALVPLFQNAVVINEGEDNEERGFIQVEECHHDEAPPQPCVVAGRWEVDRGKVI